MVGLLKIPRYSYIYIYIYIERERERERERVEFQVNFDKSIVRLLYLCIFSMFAKFQGDKKLIVMLLINCLNSSFCSLK